MNKFPLSPTPNGFTIYTKQGCKYCDKVKILLQRNGSSQMTGFLQTKSLDHVFVPCDEWLTTPEKKETFLNWVKEQNGGGGSTFPMVFFDGVFIGGYDDTVIYLTRDEVDFNSFSF
jgi:glutaredoxin